MSDPVEPLIADMVEYLAEAPRSYAEAQSAWRTSCPRLPVWEEAAERGLVARDLLPDGTPGIVLTSAGLAFLARTRRGA
ncbi:MAG: hypothetical protein NBV67_06270 [Tagaea sp.]|nr:hypothetical protein [Tagaea sp.]